MSGAGVGSGSVCRDSSVDLMQPDAERLVGMQTPLVLLHADRSGANGFSVPPPTPGVIPQTQQIICHAWVSMDTGIERGLPYVPAFLQEISPAESDAFVKTWRARNMAPPNAAGRQLNRVEIMAVVGMTTLRQSHSHSGDKSGALAERTRLRDMAIRTMQAAGRSCSPSCNVTWPDVMQNWASCHP